MLRQNKNETLSEIFRFVSQVGTMNSFLMKAASNMSNVIQDISKGLKYGIIKESLRIRYEQITTQIQ